MVWLGMLAFELPVVGEVCMVHELLDDCAQ